MLYRINLTIYIVTLCYIKKKKKKIKEHFMKITNILIYGSAQLIEGKSNLN